MDGENPSLEVNLVAGWNMIGYPCSQDMLLTDGFSSIEDIIAIVKDNNGNVYLPEFSFNGIGFLEGGQGYQVKMNEFVMGFSFCESVKYPTLEGCTDCEAVNFNQWANVDDGTCNHDSDGDGVPDSEEVVGCQDSLACDYNITATDSGECSYAQDGYDCEGSITAEIGDIIEGGFLYYLDETGTRGLVAAMEDIAEPLNWLPAMDSLNNFISNSQYNDWYLPRKNELELMYNSIGNEATNGELINFSSTGSYWSSTQNENLDLWVLRFYDGSSDWINWFNPCRVRPTRAFGDWTSGCMDETACNYNPEANMADGSCEYPEQGYDCDGNITAEIGDVIEGGYLFYIDETGQHGLVAAQEDINGTFDWGCLNQSVDNANGMTIGTGYQNTLDIVNFGCTSEYGGLIAAQACIDYQYLGYNDWFLPSIDELVQMYISIWMPDYSFTGFENSAYWSSTESNNNALVADVNFNNGYSSHSWKNSTMNVRPIRAIGNWTEGCTDETACNYNSEVNFPNSTLCEYPQLGYDCEGNITEYVIGMEAEGGIVFYIDETGEHGLVAAMEDIEGTYEWGCSQEEVVGADGITIGAGHQNTLDIVNYGCVTVNGNSTAAQASLDYETESYNDWYLPSKEELIEIGNTIGNSVNIGGLTNDVYWSSTELYTNTSWIYAFYGGGLVDYSNKNTAWLIRVIRAF